MEAMCVTYNTKYAISIRETLDFLKFNTKIFFAIT